jgi:hypothetical protein
LGSRPPTPPCIRIRTRRFNELRAVPLTTCLYPDIQVITGNHFVRTAPARAFRRPNARHSLWSHRVPSYATQGSRFSPFAAFSALARFPSVLEASIVRPFPLRSFSLDTGFPLHGTMASADFLRLSYTLPRRFRYGGTVRQSPFQVCARPPRVKASNLHPM